MNLKEPIFINPNKLIEESAEIIFVADLFAEDYVGGAELTSEAIIQESPFAVQKLHSKDVNLATLQQGINKFWIFGNFSQLNPELIPSIVANLKYSILEYDYKYCKFRSPEKHAAAEGTCDCETKINGKLVSAFYYGSQALWWMSEAQKNRYTNLFPFLLEKDNVVLSSVFSKETLGKLKHLRDTSNVKKGWIVLGSTSWVKGFEEAKAWCEKNQKEYDVVWNLPYDQVLARLSTAEGFVYLPAGADTCPRMVIEAKLLGCELHINEHVQHAKEEWFDTDNLDSIQDYLYTAPDIFWKAIKMIKNHKPTISGYITTYNCVSQEYPFKKSIQSMLQFCDEVCVVDGGSTDTTPEVLLDLQMNNSPKEERVKLIDSLKVEKGDPISISDLLTAMNAISKVKVKTIARDWSHPRHAVFDGMQKAEARKMCVGEFCWQMDSDEIVHEKDAHKIVDLCQNIPKNVNIVCLPVVEYWGGPEKVRLDIQPWKWRLSRNSSHITHGIPVELRREDENGDVFALEGTDGCDMIHAETGERLPHVTFHNTETETIRRAAASGDENAVKVYQDWFNKVIENLPGVFHYSWYDMPRKIRTYKNYWTKHWNSLYNKSMKDTAETNMMFDLPWSEVSDEMIEDLARNLKEKTGGWIWHSKWKGQQTPHLTINIVEPK